MKVLIEHRSGMRAWNVVPLILYAGILLAVSTRADVLVEGRKLPWTARIPSGWIGGTAEKIEKILADGATDPGASRLNEILRPMLPEAKAVDALFYHLDVQGTGTKTLSSLRINVVALDLETFSDEAQRKAFWSSFGKQLAKDFAEGATIEMTQDRSGTTAARKAYRGTFLSTLPAGGKVYTVLHVIAYAPGKMHVFRLRADSEKFPERLPEFDKILESLKYRAE
jgi:hypothetical protein